MDETMLHYFAYAMVAIGVTSVGWGIYSLFQRNSSVDEGEQGEQADQPETTAARTDSDESTNHHLHHQLLWWAAGLVELLGISSAILWAWYAYSDGTFFAWVMRFIFILTFTGILIAKITLVPVLLNAWKRGHGGLITSAAICLLSSATFLLFASYSHLINTTSNNAHERTVSSAPVAAIESDIELVRNRLNGLSRFADEAGVHSEAAAIEDKLKANAKRVAQLESIVNSGLSAKPANANGKVSGKTLADLTGNCGNSRSYYYRYCERIASAKAELANLGGVGTATPYASGHAEYLGFKARLVDLEKQRAELLQKGAGAETWSADVRVVADVFGIAPEKASWGIWFGITLALDLFGMLLRFIAAMHFNLAVGKSYSDLRRTVAAFETLGYDPIQMMKDAIAGNKQSSPLPAYRQGGYVDSDGLAHLHGGEFVMPPEAVQLYGVKVLQELKDMAMAKQANDSKPMAKEVNDLGPLPKEVIDSKPMAKEVIDSEPMAKEVIDLPESMAKAKAKAVGGEFLCQECGKSYIARVTWQKFCPECSGNRKRGVLKAKSFKKKAS